MSNLTGLPDGWFPDLKSRTLDEEIDRVLDDAQRAGKITASGRAGWRKQMKKTPKATTATLAKLEPLQQPGRDG